MLLLQQVWESLDFGKNLRNVTLHIISKWLHPARQGTRLKGFSWLGLEGRPSGHISKANAFSLYPSYPLSAFSLLISIPDHAWKFQSDGFYFTMSETEITRIFPEAVDRTLKMRQLTDWRSFGEK